eukprot:12422795-Karenia_brevis.AAC.1
MSVRGIKARIWAIGRTRVGERLVAEYCWDCCFPGDEFGFQWTVLAGGDRDSGNYKATTVPSKGGTGSFARDKCLDLLRECGDRENEIYIKSDQEAGIEFVITDIVDGEGTR